MKKTDHYIPAYLNVKRLKRTEAIKILKEKLEDCAYCPHVCGVNRLRSEKGICQAPAGPVVDSAGPHFGEERELVGSFGSGTIFFSYCNLKCIFCQNWTISTGRAAGGASSVSELAAAMLALQERGCHNINLVSPTPYLYPIAAAIDAAAEKGLSIPIVYNCGGYEAVSSLRLLENFIDIYMPDFKYGTDNAGELYSGAPAYFARACEALIEMQRQVGDLTVDSMGLARRGLLVRHLVMPASLAASARVAAFLKTEVSPRCAVNVMDQYYPAYRASGCPPLDRRLSRSEFTEARDEFLKAGLRLL